MKEIIFNKTGNFWFDNSLVALKSNLSTNQVQADWSPDGTALIISVDNDDLEQIVLALNNAKEKVASSYLTKTTNWGWIYVSGKFELYQRTDFRMALKPFFVGKTGKPIDKALQIPSDKGQIKRILQQSLVQFREAKETFELLVADHPKPKYAAIPSMKPDNKVLEMDDFVLQKFILFYLNQWFTKEFRV